MTGLSEKRPMGDNYSNPFEVSDIFDDKICMMYRYDDKSALLFRTLLDLLHLLKRTLNEEHI